MGGIGIYVPAAGARRKGKDCCPSRMLASPLAKFGITLFSRVFPWLRPTPASCKQQSSRTSGGSLGQSSRSRRPSRKGCSSAAKWSFQGTQKAMGFLRGRACSGPAFTQTHPHRHPAKLGLLTLQDIPASCDNLPLLRKTVGNLLLLLPAPFAVCLKGKVLPASQNQTLQMLYIAQQSVHGVMNISLCYRIFKNAQISCRHPYQRGSNPKSPWLNRSGLAHRKCKGIFLK